MSNILAKNDILTAIGNAVIAHQTGYGCNECIYRENECDLECSYDDWPSCGHEDQKISTRSNLLSFPFKKAPDDCFVLSFWHSTYADLFHPDNEKHLIRVWHRTDRFGIINNLKPASLQKSIQLSRRGKR